MNPSIAIAVLAGITASLANVVRVIHRKEKGLEQRFEAFVHPTQRAFSVNLPDGQALDLAYLKKSTPSDAALTVWLS